jgi:hypothetical protein
VETIPACVEDQKQVNKLILIFCGKSVFEGRRHKNGNNAQG